jgi:hypothetical protein
MPRMPQTTGNICHSASIIAVNGPIGPIRCGASRYASEMAAKSNMAAKAEELRSEARPQTVPSGNGIDVRFAQIYGRLDKMDGLIGGRFDKMDGQFGILHAEIRKLHSSLNEKTEALKSRIDEKTEALKSRIDEKTEALKSRIDEKTEALQSRIDEKTGALQSRLDQIDKSLDEKTKSIQSSLSETISNKMLFILLGIIPILISTVSRLLCISYIHLLMHHKDYGNNNIYDFQPSLEPATSPRKKGSRKGRHCCTSSSTSSRC